MMPRSALLLLPLPLVLSCQPGVLGAHIAGVLDAELHPGSATGAVDVDGDGYDDLVVGAPDDDDNGSDSGSVYVYS